MPATVFCTAARASWGQGRGRAPARAASFWMNIPDAPLRPVEDTATEQQQDRRSNASKLRANCAAARAVVERKGIAPYGPRPLKWPGPVGLRQAGRDNRQRHLHAPGPGRNTDLNCDERLRGPPDRIVDVPRWRLPPEGARADRQASHDRRSNRGSQQEGADRSSGQDRFRNGVALGGHAVIVRGHAAIRQDASGAHQAGRAHHHHP